MERNEILKSVGFSNEFLKALEEFEKSVPNVFYELPFNENEQSVKHVDLTGRSIIIQPNDNYSHNIIVRQA